MMRNSETREMLVGTATLLGLALVLVLSYAAAGISAKASVGSYSVTATFNRVDGLLAGDAVRMGGIDIGTVGAMHLDDDFRAVVTFRIESGVELPRDTSAAIHTDGLFGSKFVVLEPGGDENVMKSGDRIQFAQDSMIVTELLDLIISQGRQRLAGNAPE